MLGRHSERKGQETIAPYSDDNKGERKSAITIYPALLGDPGLVMIRVGSVHHQTTHANGGIGSSWSLSALSGDNKVKSRQSKAR